MDEADPDINDQIETALPLPLRSPGRDELPALTDWDELSDFELLLRLVNFEGLRSVLAQRLGWTSALSGSG